MRLLAPKYYKDFHCIADRCRHSCCVGWEIDIDSKAMKKYSELCGEYSDKIRESIEHTDPPHFRLSECDRCVHLDGRGLCKIILQCGEDYLCDICREHPRFYNTTPCGIEVGLGMSCEEAARIILSSDDYYVIEDIGEYDGDFVVFDFNPLTERSHIFAILSDASLEYTERLTKIYREYKISPAVLSDGEWRELLSSLEYLDDSHRELFAVYSSHIPSCGALDKLLERALAYFVYRHTSSAQSKGEFLESLGLVLFFERLFASMIAASEDKSEVSSYELCRIISEELEYSLENIDIIKFEFSMRQIAEN